MMLRRVEIPAFQLCSVPGCPNEIDYHGTGDAEGKCEDCGRGATVASRLQSERAALIHRSRVALDTEKRTNPVVFMPPGRRTRSLITHMEMVVLAHVAEGMNDAEIADVLDRAEETISIHIRRMTRKLQVGSREELVMEARSRGLLI